MAETPLSKQFSLLGHGAAGAVQNGRALDTIAQYLNTPRPIEETLRKQMDRIQALGGGLVLLIGNAGDGKSHLISKIKTDPAYSDFETYNDATASCSPQMTAIETLKLSLCEFSDQSLDTTKRKLLLAINLGKLNAFIEDEIVRQQYSILAEASKKCIDEESDSSMRDHHLGFVSFSNQQFFELRDDSEGGYPVSSQFLDTILQKIVVNSSDNPFYRAYLQTIETPGMGLDPTVVNYRLLQSPEVRKTIIHYTIEAIVRCKINVTPRDFLDFVKSLVVYDRISEYTEVKDFFSALLPTRLFAGGVNKITQAINRFDPIKTSSVEHDRMLSQLVISRKTPAGFLDKEVFGSVLEALLKKVDFFYTDNGLHTEDITKLLFRMKHLEAYHTDSEPYKEYLDILANYCHKDNWGKAMNQLDEMVMHCIPRHFGSYCDADGYVPLDIQGSQYRLFSSIQLELQDSYRPRFEEMSSNTFSLVIHMVWGVNGNLEKTVKLKMDYDLFEYLYYLQRGKLPISFESERNLEFNRFIRELIKVSDASKRIVIMSSENKKMQLRSQFNKLSFLA